MADTRGSIDNRTGEDGKKKFNKTKIVDNFQRQLFLYASALVVDNAHRPPYDFNIIHSNCERRELSSLPIDTGG